MMSQTKATACALLFWWQQDMHMSAVLQSQGSGNSVLPAVAK